MFTRWVKDSEFLDNSNEKTHLYFHCRKIVEYNKKLLWAFILSNLYYNSNVFSWYLNNIEWGVVISKSEILELLLNSYEGSKGTINNGILALFDTLDKSPLGKELKIGIIEKRGRERYVKKIGTDDIHPLAVAYSLYKAAEHIGRIDFTVSELYKKEFKGGPYKLFGISKDKLKRILRGLQEDKEQILRVDLVADLDNIYLRDDLSSLDIVKIAKERLK